MKKMVKVKKLFALMLAAVMMLTVFCQPAMARDAAKVIYVGAKQTTVTTGLFKGDAFIEVEEEHNLIKKGWEPTSVCSVKSSNKAVATPMKDGHGILIIKKKGTTTITYTVQMQKGAQQKIVTQKFKLKVVAYENPFKSIKVNGTKGTQYLKYVTGENTCEVFPDKVKNGNTITYTLAKNWKITKMEKAYLSDNGFKYKTLTPKSGMKVGKNAQYLIQLKNKVTGVQEYAIIDMYEY